MSNRPHVSAAAAALLALAGSSALAQRGAPAAVERGDRPPVEVSVEHGVVIERGIGPAPAQTAAAPAAPDGSAGAQTFALDGWHRGADAYNRSLRHHAKHKTPILLYLQADACDDCRRFERTLLGADAVRRYLRNAAVRVVLNPDGNSAASAGDAALAKRLGASGWPRLYIHGIAPMPSGFLFQIPKEPSPKATAAFLAQLRAALKR